MLSAVTRIPTVGETQALRPAEPTATQTRPDPTASFAEVLATLSRNGIRTMETAEATAIRGIHGGASVQDVVEAIVTAEQTLQAAVAVRDRVVAAYQEISRMAI